jgi:hypothetical protein
MQLKKVIEQPNGCSLQKANKTKRFTVSPSVSWLSLTASFTEDDYFHWLARTRAMQSFRGKDPNANDLRAKVFTASGWSEPLKIMPTPKQSA